MLSWLENKFFGDENFIGKTQCFFPLMFLFSDFFSFFFQKHRDFQINFDLVSKKIVIYFFLEHNLGTIWAGFAQSGNHNLGKINHNIASGQVA